MASTSDAPVDRARKERCSEGDSEDKADPAATTVTSVSSVPPKVCKPDLIPRGPCVKCVC